MYIYQIITYWMLPRLRPLDDVDFHLHLHLIFTYTPSC
jgi:hypothetical protein